MAGEGVEVHCALCANQPVQQWRRLQKLWRPQVVTASAADGDLLESLLGAEQAAALDLFDAVQLRAVVLECRRARSLSEAGRRLFAVSRAAKAKPNDADRLKKYLARFGLNWKGVTAPL